MARHLPEYEDRVCEFCELGFRTKREDQRYCGAQCRIGDHNRKNGQALDHVKWCPFFAIDKGSRRLILEVSGSRFSLIVNEDVSASRRDELHMTEDGTGRRVVLRIDPEEKEK